MSRNRFPLYIVSKGRWESRHTAKALLQMGADFRIVVEHQERDQYAAALGASRVLVLDPKYQDNYFSMDDLGSSKSKGPGPARNFAWDHSIAEGHSYHWVMDDNIRAFYRLNRNEKHRVFTPVFFRMMEDFVCRYENVLMAGPNYEMFVPRISSPPPFILNTRIYSCNLIRNDCPFGWRGRYNEDTDLSLRILKAGYCTIQFNAFLADKIETQRVKGGNTAEFYDKEGTGPKTKMLVKTHPDVVRLVKKWGRTHHYVDYRPFRKNKLIRKKGLKLTGQINDYGLVLQADS